MSAVVTRLMVRIAAARLDPAVTSSEFCELLEKLIDRVHDQATIPASIEAPKISTPPAPPAFKPDPPPAPPPAAPEPKHGFGWGDPPGEDSLPRPPKPPENLRSLLDAGERTKIRELARRAKGDKADYPPGFLEKLAAEYHVEVAAVVRVIEAKACGKRLSYDDKVRMRMRYDEAVEGRQRAPKGFFRELAAEFHCKEATARDVIYRRDGT